MKKTIFIIAVLFSFITLVSCGGSSDKDSKTADTTANKETADEESPETNFESITSASQASAEYKSMLEEYSELMKQGKTEEAAKMKDALDALESYANSNFSGAAELKAMGELTSIALQLESGKDIDLDDAMEAYGASMEVLDAASGGEYGEALDQTQDAMNAANAMSGAYGDY